MEIDISINSSNNTAIDFELVFRILNDELALHNEFLKLICAGGYVLQLNGYRGTNDVDAFFKSNITIENIIHKVGDAFGINKPDELWLNNSIANMNSEPLDKYCKIVYQFSNLVVLAVDLIYLVGMKLKSARGQDIRDVSEIIKNTKNLQPFELLKTLDGMGFTIDVSILLDAYGEAHGMEWLEEFYIMHEQEISKFF